nr:MAG TPA_asm: hypothetical protein [Caudoviricetes sp.]
MPHRQKHYTKELWSLCIFHQYLKIYQKMILYIMQKKDRNRYQLDS